MQAGFDTTTLMATLPGEPFYADNGDRAHGTLTHDCGGVSVPFVPMNKTLVAEM